MRDHQQDIEVERAVFRSLKGGIIRNFTVSDFISLGTSDRPIPVNITMLSTASVNSNKPTVVSVTSKRGEIDAHLSLFTLNPEDHGRKATGGSFLVDTRSYTSPINVKFHEATVLTVS